MMDRRFITERHVRHPRSATVFDIRDVRRPCGENPVVVRQRVHEPLASVRRIPRIVGQKVQPRDSKSPDLLQGRRVNWSDSGGEHEPRLLQAACSNDALAEFAEVAWAMAAKPPIEPAPKPTSRKGLRWIANRDLNVQLLRGTEKVRSHMHRVGISD